jgi:hypothetical protein
MDFGSRFTLANRMTRGTDIAGTAANRHRLDIPTAFGSLPGIEENQSAARAANCEMVEGESLWRTSASGRIGRLGYFLWGVLDVDAQLPDVGFGRRVELQRDFNVPAPTPGERRAGSASGAIAIISMAVTPSSFRY